MFTCSLIMLRFRELWLDIFEAIHRRKSVGPYAFWMMILSVAATVLGIVLLVVLWNRT